MYNEGISTAGDLMDMGVADEVIDKRGAFYNYGECAWARAGRTPRHS